MPKPKLEADRCLIIVGTEGIAFAYMESRIDPMIAAVATLVMAGAALIAFAIDRLLRIRLME